MIRPRRSEPFEPRLVTCPACKGESRYAFDNPFRPFCSARCRDLDLGDWASENHRIAAEPSRQQSDAAEQPDLLNRQGRPL